MEKTRDLTDKDVSSILKYNLVADTRKHTLLTVFTVGTMVSAFILLLTILFWLLYPYKIIEYTPDDNYNIIYGVNEKNEVEQGGKIAYEFDYVKTTDIVPKISRRFVDGVVFNAADGGVILPKGSGHAIVETDIPETLPPGTYQLEILRSFQVNPIRTIEVVDKTEEFTVIESKK